MVTLLLASTSPYRRDLLTRFGLPFQTFSPEVDETPLPNETPAQLVLRLSEMKARAGEAAFAHMPENTLIIGADQIADFEGVVFGKPGSLANAQKQLSALSGKTVVFRTGLALFNPQARRCRTVRIDVVTEYRDLTDAEINHYLHAAEPFNCAGSARSEDLGITLFERIDNNDPTALIGLPLIALARLLRAENVNPLLCRQSP